MACATGSLHGWPPNACPASYRRRLPALFTPTRAIPSPKGTQSLPGRSHKIRPSEIGSQDSVSSRLPAVTNRLSFRPARLAVAILGLTLVVSCSGNTTSPTPPPTPIPTIVPPATSSSTPLIWPLAGRDGRDWVINNYVDLDPTSGTLDYTGGTGSG